MTPNFAGSKDFWFSPSPIFSAQRAGSPERFESPLDSPSIALIDTGRFRAGPLAKLDPGRTQSTDKALRGLGNVGASIELGGFAVAQQAVVVEVGLLHPAACDRHIPPARGRQTEDDTAFDL